MDSQFIDHAILARGIGISISGKFIGRGLNFLSQVILARYLGPESFGLFAIGWVILRLVGLISPLGLDHGILQFGSRYWRKDVRKFRSVYRLSTSFALISGLFFGGCLYLSSQWLAAIFFNKSEFATIIRIFAFAVPFFTILRVLAASTTISKSMKYAILIEEITQPGVEIIMILIFLYLGWGLMGSIYAVLISTSVAFLLGVLIICKLFPEVFQGNTLELSLKALLLFSVTASFGGLFGSLISWVDRLMVGYYLDDRQTGIYTTVSLISVLFVTILSGIKMIIAPMVARLYHDGETFRLQEVYKVSTKWGLYLALPISLILLFAAKDIIFILFGPSYLTGYVPLMILVTAQMINIGTGAFDMLLIMTGNQRDWLLISLSMVSLNVLANAILIPRFGIIGAAYGTGFTVTGLFVWGLLQVRKKLNLWPYDRRFYKGFIASLVSIIGLIIISRLNLQTSILRVATTTLISFVLFGCTLIFLRMDQEDIEFLEIIRERVSKKPLI